MDATISFQDSLKSLSEFNKLILDFLDIDEVEESFQNLNQYFENHKIKQDKYNLKLILHAISKISNNHYRTANFFSKIEQIMKFFSEDIKNFYTNIEIFNIFRENKRLLLFLFEEKIITPDEQIYQIITNQEFFNKSYPQYFFPEFKQFFDEKMLKKTVMTDGGKVIDPESESFLNKRKIGENDDQACFVIRNDSVDEFKAQFDQKRSFFSLYEVKDSIFETNPFLIGKEISYLEYSAFYGSIKIFKHLIQKDGNRLSNKILPFAAHSNNIELIKLIEKNIKVEKSDNKLWKCFTESLKDHHIEFSDYLYEKYFNGIEFKNDIVFCCLRFYNFINCIDNVINGVTGFCNQGETNIDDVKKNNVFCVLCESDFISFVELFLKSKNININLPLIFLIIFCLCNFY